jgi:hypothetical protein
MYIPRKFEESDRKNKESDLRYDALTLVVAGQGMELETQQEEIVVLKKEIVVLKEENFEIKNENTGLVKTVLTLTKNANDLNSKLGLQKDVIIHKIEEIKKKEKNIEGLKIKSKLQDFKNMDQEKETSDWRAESFKLEKKIVVQGEFITDMNKKVDGYEKIKRRNIIFLIEEKFFKCGKDFLYDRETQKQKIIEYTNCALAGDLFMSGKTDGDAIAHAKLTKDELQILYKSIQPLPNFEIWLKLLRLLYKKD